MVHVGKLLYNKVLQFSTCSDPDRFVKFNRKGVLLSNGGRENSLKVIDGVPSMRDIGVPCHMGLMSKHFILGSHNPGILISDLVNSSRYFAISREP